jgi:nucleosome assembly protein 1-like 1
MSTIPYTSNNGPTEDDLEDETPFFKTLPLEVQRAVQGLRGVEVQASNIRMEFRKEVLALELKYAVKCRPLYEHRKRVILGADSVTAREVNVGEDQNKKDDEDYEKLPAPTRSIILPTPVHEFWLRALQTHPGFAQRINDDDEAALNYLTDIRITHPIQISNPGFTVEFCFNPNPYFSNTTLTKTYIYKDELGFVGTLLFSHVIGDTIHWKPAQNLIEKAVVAAKAKPKEDDDDDDDFVEESFFTFFNPSSLIVIPENQLPPRPPKVKVPGGDEDEDEDEDEEFERDMLLDDDFELGEALKDRIIPHSVEYFTGEAEYYEDGDDDFEDDEDDDEDDQEEDEDEDA